MHEAAPSFERIVYIFQGGGVLGAYQVGVFEALHVFRRSKSLKLIFIFAQE